LKTTSVGKREGLGRKCFSGAWYWELPITEPHAFQGVKTQGDWEGGKKSSGTRVDPRKITKNASSANQIAKKGKH